MAVLGGGLTKSYGWLFSLYSDRDEQEGLKKD